MMGWPAWLALLFEDSQQAHKKKWNFGIGAPSSE